MRKFLRLVPALALAYFTWHAFAGERNIPRFLVLDAEVAALKKEVSELEKSNLEMERKVISLREESIDLHRLESHSRRTLGLAEENELAILFDGVSGAPILDAEPCISNHSGAGKC